MQALDILLKRQSYNQLTEPAPSGAILDNILDAGVCVPDHGGLTPWRFIVFTGQGLKDLGEIYSEAAERQNASAEHIEKARKMPLRAPMVIAIIADIKPSEKIPQSEQLMSAACCVQAMQMAALAQGYDGIWRTGALAYDEYVKAQLKVSTDSQIVGYLYLGTAKSTPPIKPRKKGIEFCQFW